MIFGLLTISLLLEIPSWQSLSGSCIKSSALYLLLLFSTHKFNSSFPVLNYRKVLRQMASGSRDAERVKLKLEIKVEVYLFLIFFIFSLCFLFVLIELIILTKYWNFELRWSFLPNYLIRNAVLESTSSAFLIPKLLFLLKCVSIASLEGQFICLFCFRKLSLISSLAEHYKIRKKIVFDFDYGKSLQGC